MKTDTLKALKESILHWEENLADPSNGEYGEKSCALCKRFNSYDMCSLREELCPVFSKTGELFCSNTPYVEASDELRKTKNYNSELIKKEVDFLKSLLPKGEE